MKKVTAAHQEIKVGSRVKWKAGGKVARLEGLSGKMCAGTVEYIYKDGYAGVTPDHRRAESSEFHGIGSRIELSSLTLLG